MIVKAAGGGGGRGMRVVRAEAALLSAISLTKAEAGSASAMKPCTWRSTSRTRATSSSRSSPTPTATRSTSANATARCSAATKVVEEAPAPGITLEQRNRVGERCAEACRTIGYRGAGTFEFLYENGEFYFIEMNTRVQGASGDRDDHRCRYRQGAAAAASGEPSSYTQDQIQIRGHAVECRINAEDPEELHAQPG